MKAKFPGFKKCMEMMRSRDPQVQEDGFHRLLLHASEHVGELIDAFHSEDNFGLKCWLLELVDAAKSEAAFEFLADQLRSDEWQFRNWAMIGLKHLDTKQARTLLWDAQSWELESPEATEKFRNQLEDVQKQDW